MPLTQDVRALRASPARACLALALALALVLVLASCGPEDPPGSFDGNGHANGDASGSANGRARDAILVARGQDFAPFHYEEDGVLRGFEIEAIRRAAALVGRPVEFRQFPWSRCLLNAERGEVHAMMNVFRTPEREGFMIYSDENVLHHEVNALWKRRDRVDVTYSGEPADLRRYRVGVVRDYSYGPGFDSVAESLDRQFSVGEEDLMQKLVHARVDVIVGNNLVVGWLATRAGVRDEIEILEPTVSKDPLYLAFSKAVPGNDRLAREFGSALRRFQSTGEYREILARYGVTPESPTPH